ncbi:MAG: biotin/lipoyl-binding protein [Alphaproteobacteria bacterium]|nr:biotin/lipoyl-binding protein [Alphaproteobacteria bacterium]
MSIRSYTRYALPAAALGLFGFAVVATIRPSLGQTEPVIGPPQTPYEASVAGVGVVEPESELLSIATELPGVIRAVHVAPGAQVAAGDALFSLDDRAQRAALAQAQAQASAARAAAAAADVALADESQRLQLFEAVADPRAVSADEVARRRFAAQRAEAALAQARASAAAADAQVRVIRTEIDRLTVRAPIAGRVFQVNARLGEFAAAGPTTEPLVTMGAAQTMHVRVEIDEADIARVQDNAGAVGALRGRSSQRIPLTFVRMEPQAVEKRALAGGSERVDTRVIEAIYAFDPAASPAYVGQRMDVFIEASPLLRSAERAS